jgi:hypothetical protein
VRCASGDVERLAPDQETRILEDTGILQSSTNHGEFFIVGSATREYIEQLFADEQWKTTNQNGLVHKTFEFHSLDAFALLL